MTVRAIISEIDRLFTTFPFLKEDRHIMSEYKALQRENNKSGPKAQKVQDIYEALVSGLGALEIDLSELCAFQHSFGQQRMVHGFYLPPTLPSSFEEFNVRQTSNLKNDQLSSRHVSALAASMIMGEEKGGLEIVPKKYQDTVRHEILRILAEAVFEVPEVNDDVIADLDTALYRDQLHEFTDSDDEALELAADYLKESDLDHQFVNIICLIRQFISSTGLKKVPKTTQERQRLVKEFYAKSGGRIEVIQNARKIDQESLRQSSHNPYSTGETRDQPWISTHVKAPDEVN